MVFSVLPRIADAIQLLQYDRSSWYRLASITFGRSTTLRANFAWLKKKETNLISTRARRSRAFLRTSKPRSRDVMPRTAKRTKFVIARKNNGTHFFGRPLEIRKALTFPRLPIYGT